MFFRSGAAIALGKIGDKSAVEPLIHTIKDKSFVVQENAVFALGEIGDKRAIEPIMQIVNMQPIGIIDIKTETTGEGLAGSILQDMLRKDKHIRKMILAAKKALDKIKQK